MLKKSSKVILIIATILSFSFTTYAKWIHSDKLNCWYYFDENSRKLVNTGWQEIEDDKGIIKYYYFNPNGILLTNTITPAGKQVNANGEYVINGVVQSKIKTIIATNKNNTNKTIDTTKTNNNTVIQSSSSGRLLKNYILGSSNVEIIKEKYINGAKKTNVIAFKENGAFISVDTKKYNKITIKAERDKTFSDKDYRLVLVVNGIEEDELDFEEEEYSVEKIFEFSLNAEVDLIMYVNGEETNSWNQNYLYITNGRMSKYKEEE